MYYEGKIKYNNAVGDTIKEDYIIDGCELHGEAETALYQHISNYGFDESDVLSVKRTKIMEFVNNTKSDEDYIYYATIASIFLDEKTGKEKETRYIVAVYANDIDSATKYVNEYMKQRMEDLKLICIKRTKIVEVIKY